MSATDSLRTLSRTGIMIARSIGIVICRIGAALLVAQALQNVGFMINPWDDFSGFTPAFLAKLTVFTAAPLVGAIILWFFAEKICSIGAVLHEAHTDMQVTRTDIVTAGTYLIGIYLIAFGIVGAIQFETLYTLQMEDVSDSEKISNMIDAQRVSLRVRHAIQIVIGAVLLIYGRKSR